jgi:hypothetical protein
MQPINREVHITINERLIPVLSEILAETDLDTVVPDMDPVDDPLYGDLQQLRRSLDMIMDGDIGIHVTDINISWPYIANVTFGKEGSYPFLDTGLFSAA